MRVLCVYYDKEENWLTTDPVEELEDCDVVEAHSFKETLGLIGRKGIIAHFDIILADMFLPRNDGGQVYCFGNLFTLMLCLSGMRGVGLFIPQSAMINRTLVHDFNGRRLVASKECWTITGKRDWKALYDEVLGT